MIDDSAPLGRRRALPGGQRRDSHAPKIPLRYRAGALVPLLIGTLLALPRGSEPEDTPPHPASAGAAPPQLAAASPAPGAVPAHSTGAAGRPATATRAPALVATDGAIPVVLAAAAVWDPKTARIHLVGSQSGLHRVASRYDAETHTLTLKSSRLFLPGECLRLAIALTEPTPGVHSTIRVAAKRAPAQFARASRLAVGAGPNMVAAADLDGDGDPDLVASDVQGDDALHVFLNDGGTSFTPLRVPLPGIEDPSRFALADLDRDGHVDLIAPGENSGNLLVLRGRGDGRFAASPLHALEAPSPVQAVAGDLDLDGQDEIAIAHLRGADRISILAGDAGGDLGRERRVRVGRGIGALALTDLDGDQDLDLAAANEDTDQLLLFHNLGDGRFELAHTLRTGDRPEAVLAGDLNGDAIPDLVTTNQGANDISVVLARARADARGEIAYADPVAYAAGDRPFIPALADLDGDGDLDLAVPGLLSDDVTVLLNQGQGRFTRGVRIGVDPGPVCVQAADFNGDGALDLAVVCSIADNVTLYHNTNATWAPPGPVGAGSAIAGAQGAASAANAAGRSEAPGAASPELLQNVPNPFNPATAISFQLEKPGRVLLVVFNSSGKVVRTLVDEDRAAGAHVVAWDGTTDAGEKAPSGTYFYRLTTEDTVELRRMTLIR